VKPAASWTRFGETLMPWFIAASSITQDARTWMVITTPYDSKDDAKQVADDLARDPDYAGQAFAVVEAEDGIAELERVWETAS
jgi:hypothetical protein